VLGVLHRTPVGTRIDATVVRGGAMETIGVTVGERPRGR
jgi:hypothetical protein